MFKYILFFVVLILFLPVVDAQQFSPPSRLHHNRVENDTINQYNEDNKRTGYWTDHFQNGNPRYDGYFNNGEPVGKFTYYFPEGGIRAELIHIENENDGENENVVQATFYHRTSRRQHRDSRKKMAGGQFINQKKHGLWRFFNDRGTLVAKNYFHNDINHGVWKSFYPSGQLSEIVTYHHGEKQGEWKQYYENGNIRTEANYNNDKLNDEYFTYYDDGSKMIEGYYYNNLQHKRWTHYSRNGQIEQIIVYDKGEIIEENIFIEREDGDVTPIRRIENPYEDVFEGLF